MATLPTVTANFIGRRCIFRNGRMLKEGLIQELSPAGDFVRFNASTWLANDPGVVVSLLPDAEIERGNSLPDPRARKA